MCLSHSHTGHAVWASISYTFGIPSISVNTVLSQIFTGLGYDEFNTDLYTVAPNVCGAAFHIFATQSSEPFPEPGLHIFFCLLVGLVKWNMVAKVTASNVYAMYGASFLAAMGAFASSVLVSAWYTNNTSSESKRAVLAAATVSYAGLMSANSF
ncbi:hypothetical protein K437DRAFT_271073 [Tilletiaria anomala UBC 951]|uniref:Uncharacterized protein n=1 Tax=Tilletiaria anomala (strain ATCC 24038 / CBS 436.72 / UBC 951) TaxID=1037660 RepID=A0A066V567_TILAU|nr:uncharacterized protein K437DRAFT_271073 [Tilletiaria anomala UBC 951]KDN36636.1 hypothetical protein K437DRAFT_271073 [Tilletiaria anomala UBC 951]